MEMRHLKSYLIEWVDQYIDYNADIDKYDYADYIHEVKNTNDLAKRIINHIFDSLKDLSDNDFYWLMEEHCQETINTPQEADKQLEQELDEQWEKVKRNNILVYDEEAVIEQEYWNMLTNIADQLGTSDRVTMVQGPTMATNPYDILMERVNADQEYREKLKTGDQPSPTNLADQLCMTNHRDQRDKTNSDDQQVRPTPVTNMPDQQALDQDTVALYEHFYHMPEKGRE